MKPGDLVKLVLPHDARWPAGVVVSWVHPFFDLPPVDYEPPEPSRFPEGTLAVFLSDDSGILGALDTRILVEGRVGWVWSRYLEVIDEAR
jgi:hypothetical protein